MAEVLLHEHLERVRVCLRAGQYANTLARGRHILRYYPRHIETYRLLAEASLESDDLSSAADLFKRVLSADPENVVAFVGLSVTAVQRQKLDEGIWYLERAFEIQSSNPDLRKELGRLYEERDGTSHERINLTTAALARLYARQGLFPQAIREFRAVLRTDPTRLDLQAALAETLYRAGHREAAAEAAKALLDQLPFCLKANLLLGAIWAENGVDEGLMLLRRARGLDPECTLARDLLLDHWDGFQPPTLPDFDEESSAEYSPSAPTYYAQPADGILQSLDEKTVPEKEGSELKPPVEYLPSAAGSAVPSPVQQQAAESGIPATTPRVRPSIPLVAPTIAGAIARLPAWLGLDRGTEVKEQSPATAEQEVPAPWLDELRKSFEIQPAPIAETRAEEETGTAGLESESEDLPDWLKRIPSALTEEGLASSSALPGWIRESEGGKPANGSGSPTKESGAGSGEPPRPTEVKTDTLDNTREEPTSAEADADEMPDWLKAVRPDATNAPLDEGPLPDWLAGASAAEPPPSQVTQPESVVPPVDHEPPPALPLEEALPDWLQPSAPAAGKATTAATPGAVEPPAPAGTAQIQVAAKQPAGLYGTLSEARNLRALGDLEAAVEAYEKVVQTEPRSAKDVIADLEEFVGQPDVPVRAHRILGDAYATVGRYKEALEQYRFVLGK